ncbi:hypothetical protein [Kribbella sp. NPDC004536]|uniref:hypothetical protein n=1 Tax=Kribbella sp. NPDC004536 TaxID=3364106 RepID=UPI003675267A
MLITGIIGTSLAVPAVASADDPPTSTVVVSQTTLSPGDTFTVTQTVYNNQAFTAVAGKATLYVPGANLPDWLEIVSCPEATAGCGVYNGEEFRAGFGDVGPGESRTVTWTLRVKDNAPLGSFVLWHVFLGDNYGYPAYAGPTLTVVPLAADVAVSLTASVKTLVTARITYTITVKNNGPRDASGIRVVGTYPAGLVWAGSTCARVGTTRSVNCDIASLAVGASTTRTLTVDTTLLTVGSLTATAQRTASSPDDPVASNDKASRTCTALTGLVVRC